MLMTKQGAQRVFVSIARDLYKWYRHNGRTELMGCKLVENSVYIKIENPQFSVIVTKCGKFRTSKAKTLASPTGSA